jgi:BolA protein
LKIGPMGAILDAIQDKLTAAFRPTRLEIVDDSHRHAGHAGAREGGESHFNVTIESPAFAGAGRVARQRMVYHALAEELAGPVHALSVKALAPGET